MLVSVHPSVSCFLRSFSPFVSPLQLVLWKVYKLFSYLDLRHFCRGWKHVRKGYSCCKANNSNSSSLQVLSLVKFFYIRDVQIRGRVQLEGRDFIDFKYFSRILKNIDVPESFILLFFREKIWLTRFFLMKEVKPPPDRKMIKLLTVDDLFPSLRHSRERSRLPVKMALVHAHALLSIEKISFSQSSSLNL